MNKEQFYKALNNIVDSERLTNEETYIINDYVGYLETENKKINKAIEYIENELSEECGNVCGSDLPYYVIDELLDILKGSDKE